MSVSNILLSEEDLSLFKEYKSRLDAENSLYEFARQAWSHVEGDEEFVDGWHIAALCEHLEAVFYRKIQRLLVNLPPRCMKSILLSVLFPAWVWIKNPREQFLYTSYAAALSERDSLKCRRLIESIWYQTRWGERYRITSDQNTKIKFENDKKGYRLATSMEGKATGEGGSIIVVEDPNNAKDGESDIKRERTNDIWAQSFSTRLNNKKTGCIIGSQQRLHQMDWSGYVMANDKNNKWTKFILPMEFEEKRKCKTIILPSTKGKIWEDPRVKEGELLWPDRFGQKEIEELKADLKTSYRIAGQLQQRPAPQEGGIFKKSWFRWWKKEKPPHILTTIQSWDTALDINDGASYSACTTWGYFVDEYKIPNIILLSLWRARIEYPDLRKLAKNLFEDYRNDGTINITPDGHHSADMLLIEAKASGILLIQDLRRTGINALRFDPTTHGDKNLRAQLASAFIEAGQVWVPAQPPSYLNLRPSAETLVELCSVFPNAEARDVVDTMSQVIIKLSKGGYLTHKKDPRILQASKSGEKNKFYDDY